MPTQHIDGSAAVSGMLADSKAANKKRTAVNTTNKITMPL
jgi:hypothetical protein